VIALSFYIVCFRLSSVMLQVWAIASGKVPIIVETELVTSGLLRDLATYKSVPRTGSERKVQEIVLRGAQLVECACKLLPFRGSGGFVLQCVRAIEQCGLRDFYSLEQQLVVALLHSCFVFARPLRITNGWDRRRCWFGPDGSSPYE
jgi:hypothetical protein